MTITLAAFAAAFLTTQAALVYVFLRAGAALLDRVDVQRAIERDEHASERRELYQRIQAPEVAVATHTVENTPDLGYVDPLSDTDYWQHAAGPPVTTLG